MRDRMNKDLVYARGERNLGEQSGRVSRVEFMFKI